MRKQLIALVAGAGLAGCSVAPGYRQPALPIAPSYGDSGPAAQGRAASDIGWRDYFGDPRLRSYLEAALSNNRDLVASLARIAEARAQYRIQDSARLPNIALSGAANRTRTPLDVAGIDPAAAPGVSGVTGDLYRAGVGVSAFELDLWGRVRNLSDAARANYLASIEGARAFRLSLISSVAAAYFELRAGEEQIALAEQTVASRREGAAIARDRMDAGVTSSIDYDQSMTLLTQARTELAQVQRTTAQTENLLTVLIGGPLATPPPPPRAIDDQGLVTDIAAGLPSALLTNRPDILQAEQQLRAANANIGAARAAFFPTISLTGNSGFASTDLSNLFQGPAHSWSFGGLLDLPIFDFGRRRADLGVARARRDQAVAGYQKAVQTAFREVADALVGRQRLREQIAAQVDAVAAQSRLAETARLRYDNGIALYLEVLDAERNLFGSEQQLLQLRSAELQNAVSLYVALGGGLRESDTTP